MNANDRLYRQVFGIDRDPVVKCQECGLIPANQERAYICNRCGGKVS